MKIILSNTSRGAYQGVLSHLEANLSSGVQNIVIAPDRFAAYIERSTLKDLHKDGFFNVDVMSFTRLANKLIGSQINKCLTPEGSVMLIGKVIADLRSQLKYYGKVAMVEGFASELYAALTAIRNSGITTQQLLAKQNDMSPSMRAKTQDIALIYAGYLSALEGKHSDASTKLYTLAQYIQDNPSSVSTTNFYVVDIFDFSHPELEILKGIAKNALSLTVGMPSGYDNENRRIYPDRVTSKLKKFADVKVEIETCNEDLSPALSAISKNLFAYLNTDGEQMTVNDNKVSLRVAKDRHDEVLRLALDICKSVREGARYRDFEVYVGDLTGYENDIKSVFARYDIPCFIDKKEMLSEQAKLKYLMSAIACVRTNFKMQEVLDFVKNPLFVAMCQHGLDDVCLFENYCLKYNVEHSRLEKEFDLKTVEKYKKNQKQYFINANDDDKVEDLQCDEECDVPNSVRNLLCQTLLPLKKLGNANIKEYVLAMRNLLCGIDKQWSEYVNKLAGIDTYYVKCANQVDNKINAVLDEIDDVLDYQTDIIGFESVFKSMIKTLKIALVPTYLDSVFVGDKDSRFSGEGNIYVLGANNGYMPCVSGGGAVISPNDEKMLELVGVEIYPNQHDKVFSSMYAICDLMTKTKGRLVVSYAQTGAGEALHPANIIFELQNMLAQGNQPLDIECIDFDNLAQLDEQDLALLLSTQKSCYHQVLRGKSVGKLEDGEVYATAYEFVGQQMKKQLENAFDVPQRIELPKGSYFDESTSVSRLETFFHCPYQHYFKYILSLAKRKDGKFEGTENGIILHAVLEQFFGDLKDGKVNQNNVEERANVYYYNAIKQNEYQRLCEKADTGRVLERVRREGINLCKDMLKLQVHSQFAPTMLEARIGDDPIKPFALHADGKDVRVSGVIDRVDILDGRFYIVDYKTYKSASLTLAKLYYGEKLQLYIYMRAVENSLDLQPCGVFYLPIFSSYLEEGGQRYKYAGQTSDSLEVMQLIDDRVSDSPKEAIIPYKFTKKSGFNKNVHLSSKSLDMLGDYAIMLASKGAQEIANGFIKPTSTVGACTNCQYSDICGFKGEFERRQSAKEIETFEDIFKDKDEQNVGDSQNTCNQNAKGGVTNE